MDENFKAKIINRSHDFLPILGGKIIDLRTGEVRDRTKNDYFSFECPVEYIPINEWTDIDEQDRKKFIDQIFMGDREYIEFIHILFGSFLSGRTNRTNYIFHGHGKNGKSSIMDAIGIILGKFFGYISPNVIIHDPSSHRKNNESSHTSYLIPIDGKRLIITQELEPKNTINGGLFKKLASSDPIEGVREAYGKKTVEIYPFCKLVVPTNVIPRFDNERSVTDRIVFCPFFSRFLTKEALKKEIEDGLYDESTYKYFPSDEQFVEKYKSPGRNINILFSWLVQGCVSFYKLRNDGMVLPNIVKKYIDEKVGENDVISQWIDEKCNVTTPENWEKMNKKERKKNQELGSELFQSFTAWELSNGNGKEGAFGRIKFYEALSNKFKKRRDTDGFVFERIATIK